MKRKFLSSLFLIVLLNLLVKPFYILGIDAAVQNRVGEEIYGNYFALLNFSFLLNILLDLGITNYNTRNIAQHPHLLAKHFYRILSLRFTLFFLYAGFTLFAGLLVGYTSYEFYLLCILLVNQFLVAIIQFSRSNFAGLHLFKTDAVVSVLDRSLLIIICSILLWTNVTGGEFYIEWFIYAQTLAYGITAILSIGLLSKQIGKIKLQLKKTFSKAILKKSFPYALLIFLMMMYNRVDAVMIERLLADGDEQAGIYAQGFRLLDAVNMFALLFAGLLLPIFARLLKKKESIKEMMELAFRILGGVSIIIAIVAYWYQSELLGYRYPDVSMQSSITFGFLILSFIPVSITYVFGTLLTANGSLRQLNYMAVFGVVLNIVLNFILIQKFQVMGAAIATLVTQLLTAFIQLVLVYKIFRIEFNWRLYASIITLIGFMLLILWGQTKISMPVNTPALILIQLALGIVAAFVLRIFRISDFTSLMKEK